MYRTRRRRTLPLLLATTVTVASVGVFSPIGASPANASPVKGWTVYVGSDNSGITPIETTKKRAGTPISIGSRVQSVAITPNGATAYVATADDGVVPIDVASNTIEPSIPVQDPVGVAITPSGATAYVATVDDGVVPIDVASNTVEPSIPVQELSAIAIAPDGATAYVLGPSSVIPIDLSTDTIEASIPVQSPVAIAIAPDGATAYVTVLDVDEVVPINLATDTAETPIPISVQNSFLPSGIGITPNGATAYVISGTVVVPIDLVTDTVGSPIQVENSGLLPISGGIAITPNGATAFVDTPNEAAGKGAPPSSVTPIDTTTNTIAKPILVPIPSAIAITPDQPPVARLSVQPKGPGKPTRFDASRSTVAVGSIKSYAWSFGDGSMATTSKPVTTHRYVAPGSYTATVTETDTAGTSTTQVFTGQTMSQNGGPSAVASRSFTVSPAH